jgi:biotin carboxylase
MKQKKVMILGASAFYVDSILSAKEIGYKVFVTDRNPDSVGFQYADSYAVVNIVDIEKSIKVAREEHIDGIVPLNDFGVPTAAAVAQSLNLVGISPEVARYATSKAEMRRIWKEKGIPSPKYKIACTLKEAYRCADELRAYPLIFKPANSMGGGSRGVSKVDCRQEIEKAFAFAQEFYDDKHVVIEEYMHGSEHSIEAILYNGQIYILAICDNIKITPPYRVNKSMVYPTNLPPKELEQCKSVVKEAIKAIGIEVGAAHVETCMTREGPRLFELGARCGGGAIPSTIVSYVSGVEMFKEVMRISAGDRPTNLIPKSQGICVYRFLSAPSGKIKKIKGVNKVRSMQNILSFDLVVKEGDFVGPLRTTSDRVGFLVASGNSREEAIKRAEEAAETLIFEVE